MEQREPLVRCQFAPMAAKTLRLDKMIDLEQIGYFLFMEQQEGERIIMLSLASYQLCMSLNRLFYAFRLNADVSLGNGEKNIFQKPVAFFVAVSYNKTKARTRYIFRRTNQ